MNNQDKVTMKHCYHIIRDPDLEEYFCAMRRIPCACTGYVEKSPTTGYLTWIKPFNHIMLSNPKHVRTLPYYVAIKNGIFPNRL